MLPVGTAAKEGRDEMILHGDCINKIKELDDNSVDAIVTDPPYELGFQDQLNKRGGKRMPLSRGFYTK